MNMNHCKILRVIIISYIFALSCAKLPSTTAPVIENEWLLIEESGPVIENDSSPEKPEQSQLPTSNDNEPLDEELEPPSITKNDESLEEELGLPSINENDESLEEKLEPPPATQNDGSFVKNQRDGRSEGSVQNAQKDCILAGCAEVRKQLNLKPKFEDVRLSTSVSKPPSNSAGAYTPKTVGKIVNFLNERLLSEIDGTDNLFFSPFSISVALAKTYLGTRGATASEMDHALGYTRYLHNYTRSVHVIFEEKIHELENTSDEYKLFVANGLFLQKGYELRKEFVDDLKELYGSKTVSVDFARNGSAALKEINQWSFNKTQGKIPILIDGSLNPATKLLLLNAIYFQGFWNHPFNAKQTHPGQFLKADGTKKDVQYMLHKRKFSYFSDPKLKYEFLSLPYKGNHMSMWFILPHNMSEFPTIEVNSKLLSYVRQNLRRETVMVRIPKFQMSYKRDLTNDLVNLGLPTLFSKSGANLSGMRTQNDLYVSKVIHRALIDVNEQGTEAAAVTGVVVESRTRSPTPIKYFYAYHPFLFCILDKRSSTILFMGRVSDP